jgi:tetratricopeptide (TPR) repeat protein
LVPLAVQIIFAFELGLSMSFRLILSILFLMLSTLPLRATTSNDYYVAGFDLYARKDYAKSITYMKAAVQLDPQNWKAWQILGYDYYLSNEPALALAAFDHSLRWHSRNAELWNLAESIRARIVWENERNDIYPRAFRNYGIWVKLQSGVMASSLGDLSKAASAFSTYYSNLKIQNSAAADGFGPFGGLEVGFMLDTYNAWGVVLDGATLNGYNAQIKENGGSLNESIQPKMISVQAEYFRFFKMGRTRLYANLGGGLYNTIVDLNYVNNGVVFESGEMAGMGLGGFIGAGWEIALGDQFSASLFARARVATTGNIQGTTINGFGSSQTSVLSTDSNGLVEPNLVGTNGTKPVNVDYTGADVGLSISYHY